MCFGFLLFCKILQELAQAYYFFLRDIRTVFPGLPEDQLHIPSTWHSPIRIIVDNIDLKSFGDCDVAKTLSYVDGCMRRYPGKWPEPMYWHSYARRGEGEDDDGGHIEVWLCPTPLLRPAY